MLLNLDKYLTYVKELQSINKSVDFEPLISHLENEIEKRYDETKS